jgi:hypothetical protein
MVMESWEYSIYISCGECEVIRGGLDSHPFLSYSYTYIPSSSLSRRSNDRGTSCILNSPLSQTPPLSTTTSSSRFPKLPQIPEITQPRRSSYLHLRWINHTTNLPGKRSLDLELWTRVFTLDFGQGVITIP